MKSIALLLLFALVLVAAGPIDDGLIDPNTPRRVANPSPDDVDAVVVDVGDERPRFPTRRRFLNLRPFNFDRDDFDEEPEDEGMGMGYGPFIGYRPYGYGFGFRPSYGRENFFDILRRQMEILRRQYFHRIFNITSGFGPIGDLPPDYHNSTYTTKVVNGSVISVNETVKKHSSNDSSFVFRFKVINIRPENETVPAEGGESQPEGVVPVEGGESNPELEPVQPTRAPEATSTRTSSTSSVTESAQTEEVPMATSTPNPEDEIFNDVNRGGMTFR